MIVKCPDCSAKVDATVLATHEALTDVDVVDFDPDTNRWPHRGTLLVCPVCKGIILGIELEDPSGENDWATLQVVWPPTKSVILGEAIPSQIRASLREAHLSLEAGANIASAAMSGRAIEGICRH